MYCGKITAFKPILHRLSLRLSTRALQTSGNSLPILEVERKFTPTKDSIARLRNNDGSPLFISHAYHGRKLIKDTYIDSDSEILMNKGIYYRMRNGEFEAKVRKGGDRVNSSFVEFNGREECEKVLASAAADANLRLEQLQRLLKPWGELHTLRDEWKIDDFNVVIDSTLFVSQIHGQSVSQQEPHVVGEVELCQDSLHEDQGYAEKEMDEKIKAFMERHAWAFPSSDRKVVGKLTAFEKWKEGSHDGLQAAEKQN
jgi:thiamine-triphosphatase